MIQPVTKTQVRKKDVLAFQTQKMGSKKGPIPEGNFHPSKKGEIPGKEKTRIKG